MHRAGGVWWDVGCGDGYGTTLLPGDEVWGFDKLRNRSRDGVRFVKCDLRKPGWYGEASRPDVIVSIELLEHLEMEHQYDLLATLHARAWPRATLVLCCPIGHGTASDTNPWHVHEPRASELRTALAHTGWRSTYFEQQRYVSTSGPAVQAYVVAHAD